MGNGCLLKLNQETQVWKLMRNVRARCYPNKLGYVNLQADVGILVRPPVKCRSEYLMSLSREQHVG
jgi:hypothetical protein